MNRLVSAQTALEACGADLTDVVKWNVYVVQGQPLQPAFEAFQKVWGQRPNPPAITMAFVSGLARPEFLEEMDAVGVDGFFTGQKSAFPKEGERIITLAYKKIRAVFRQ